MADSPNDEHSTRSGIQAVSDPDEPGNLEDDLFGGEEDDDESGQEQPREDEDEQARRRALEYEEEPVSHPSHTKNLHIAEAPLPNLPFPKPSDGKHWDLRFPNFLTLNPAPFSDEDFLKEEEGSDKDGEAGASKAMIADHNVIRWRWKQGPDGKPTRQSNARVVCWEDGSQSLQVGSELFDMVYTIDSRHQPTGNQPQSGPVQGLTYLFAQHSDLKMLESQSSITGQISLRPYTLDSLTHRTLVANRSLSKTHVQRQTQTKVVTDDPDKQKLDKELEEARKLKEHKKMESKLARHSNRQANLLDTGPKGKGVRKRKFNAPLLSDEGEAEEGAGDEDDYEEMDEEEEEEEEENEPRDGKRSPGQEAELSELELADQRLEQAERQKRADREQQSARRAEGSANEAKVTKRKLIIASDDED